MQLATNPAQNHVMLRRRKNVWYSIHDGNWSDPNTWISNALDRHLITMPQMGDDVYINHTVTCDVTATVNNLYGNGYLSLSTGKILTINGSIQITGTVDQTATTTNLILNGYSNLIVNYTASTTGTITYNGLLTQNVMPLPYGSLTTSNSGGKLLTANTSLSGKLTVSSNLECSTFDLTVNGITNIENANTGLFSKNGAGNLLFIGKFSADLSTGFATINFSGNPNVEFRGGLSAQCFSFNTGTGTFTFSTNNQSLTLTSGVTWVAPILIRGAITLSTNNSVNVPIPTVINGDNASSTLNNQTGLYLSSSTLPMATGIFNYMIGSSSVILGYVMNGTFTLPYTTYAGLYIGGTGVKTLGGNTTVQVLNVNTNLECSTFNLTVNGTTSISNGDNGVFSKSGAGSLLFVGQFSANSSVGYSTIDWTGGNPSIEFRGGLLVESFSFKSGTGTFTFSTNNQTISVTGLGGSGNWSAPILVSGSITLTNTSSSLFICSGALNGDNASSIFDNRGTINYQNATAPMVTGKLYCNQAANTFIYGMAGNQDIQPPSDPSTPGYKNLTLQGSGAKKLLGNVSVKGTYTLTGPATLNSNGFALTNP
jgi:hypothetical protein